MEGWIEDGCCKDLENNYQGMRGWEMEMEMEMEMGRREVRRERPSNDCGEREEMELSCSNGKRKG